MMDYRKQHKTAVMTPKDFYKLFRQKEKVNFDDAVDFAKLCLKEKSLPDNQHWKVFLEMADAAKRANRFADARGWYRTVLQLQRHLPHGWIEYAKMEEECGRLHSCEAILSEAIKFCVFSEPLVLKCIKHYEKLGDIDKARATIETIKNLPPSKTWKIQLELCGVEVRLANLKVARQMLLNLIETVPWCGPAFLDLAKLEERMGNISSGLNIAQKGLQSSTRFGPLWFLLFRLSTLMESNLSSLSHGVMFKSDDIALRFLQKFGIDSKTLSSVEHQSSKLSFPETKKHLQKALSSVSREVVWKVFFESAALFDKEVDLENSRRCLIQASLCCPTNLRWKIWLQAARSEILFNLSSVRSGGILGNICESRLEKLLKRALEEVPEKTRSVVALDISRFQEVLGKRDCARKVLEAARKDPKADWKVYLEMILLELRCNRRKEAFEVVEKALQKFKGTGRLWSMKVNLSSLFGEETQVQAFKTALKQVPKSGEVWCEGARIHMNPLYSCFNLQKAKRFLEFAILFTPQYGDSFIEYTRLLMLSIMVKFKGNITSSKLLTETFEIIDFQVLQNRCMNADPNYGSLWFGCKTLDSDLPQKVVVNAATALSQELIHLSEYYISALKGMPLKQETEFDFSTGLSSVNWILSNIDHLTDQEKYRVVYGADTLTA